MNRMFMKSFRSFEILIVPQQSNKKIWSKEVIVLWGGLTEQIVLNLLYSLTFGTILFLPRTPNKTSNLS